MKKLLIAPFLLLSLAAFCQQRPQFSAGAKVKGLSSIINKGKTHLSWVESAYQNYGHFITRATTPSFMQKKGVATIMYVGLSSYKRDEGADVAVTSFQPRVSMKLHWRLN